MARFDLYPSDKNEIRDKMRRINRERSESQPLEKPSSGSWFKNPTIDGEKKSAWKIVDEAGCRGLREGNAQVSEKHCNFFVNLGDAKASEFEALSQRVEQIVQDKLGITLEREVRFIG